MSAEAQFRSALRWYPRSWRKANEDVMVGTLLDVADGEGRVAPTRDELRDLRRSGRAAHADRFLTGALRDRVASISLGAGAGMALVLITGQAWAPWSSQGSPAEPVPEQLVWQILVHPGIWILAALTALLGWTVVSRVLLAVTLPASAIAVFSPDVSFLLRPAFFAILMMAALAILAMIGRPRRIWTLGAAGLFVVAFVVWVNFLGPFRGTYFPRGGLIDMIASPLPLLLFFVAIVVFLARSRRVAAAGLMVASAPWLVLFVADALHLNGFLGDAALLVRLTGILVAALVIPIGMALVARRYAGPSWHSPSESSDSRTSASRPSSTP